MIKDLGETNLFTSHFVIGDTELDRTFTKVESIEIEVLYKWLDYRYYNMGFDGYRTEDEYYSYKRRCIYFLEIVELEQFKKVTEELYHTYSREFPYSKKKDFVTFVFDNTISFLKRFLKLNLDWIGEIEIPNEGEYIFYMDKDDIHTEFSDFVIKSKYDIEHYRQYYKAVLKYLKSFKAEKIIEPQEHTKRKSKVNEALILIKPEVIDRLHNELKGYFQGNEAELKKALKGEELTDALLFPHNQNKFVEVFKRLKYNGFLLSKPKEIKDWICSTFQYQSNRGGKKEIREFNPESVHDILTKEKGEPKRTERICSIDVDWLPYKSQSQRQREAKKENI